MLSLTSGKVTLPSNPGSSPSSITRAVNTVGRSDKCCCPGGATGDKQTGQVLELGESGATGGTAGWCSRTVVLIACGLFQTNPKYVLVLIINHLINL